jgi:hypothetical protein
MFERFPNEQYYTIDKDDSKLSFLRNEENKITHQGIKTELKALNGENIILTPKGVKELSHYYKKKYNINIEVISASYDTYAEELIRSLKECLKTKLEKNSKPIKYGFIVFNWDIGMNGHANAVILERTHAQDRLYFLGHIKYIQYKDYQKSLLDELKKEKEKPKSWDCKIEIHSQFPTLEMWAFRDGRQLDQSSCTIIALSGLKDCLKMKASLFDIIQERNKYIETLYDVHFALLPEELLKSCQIESEIKTSNLKQIIHQHRVKDGERNPIQEIQNISLEVFRGNYAIATTYKPGVLFGSYTLHKGRKYAARIEQLWKQQRDQEVHHILDILAQLKSLIDATSFYNNEVILSEGNIFLDPLRSDIPYDCLAGDRIRLICNAILMTKNPPNDFKVDSIYQKKAKSAEELLIMLIADHKQPTIKMHFKNLENCTKDNESESKLYVYLKEIREKAEQLANARADLTKQSIKIRNQYYARLHAINPYNQTFKKPNNVKKTNDICRPGQ